jgi:hypothetical protein
MGTSVKPGNHQCELIRLCTRICEENNLKGTKATSHKVQSTKIIYTYPKYLVFLAIKSKLL